MRYSDILLTVKWEDVLNEAVPSLNHIRKNSIRHVSGQFSINPVLIIGKVIQDQMRGTEYAFQGDENFRISIKSFANDLSRFDQLFVLQEGQIQTSSLEYALQNAFRNKEEMIGDFLNICQAISKTHNIPESPRMKAKQNVQDKTFKRNEEESIKLELPFSSRQCWHLSATHFGAQEDESSIGRGIMSSIDMAPSLFQKWGVPFDYLESNGEIYSAHSGYFYKHSKCSLLVQHDKSSFATYYSHLDVNDIEDGAYIEQGYSLGRISLDPDTSNCKCDWPSKSFACATGPHVHFELRKDGKPAHLQDQVISNLKVNTGILPHDMYCTDAEGDCTRATFRGELCATYYTDLNTGEKICPVTKGSNMGNI